MENAVILLIIIVVCIFGIKSYAERLTQGCCGTGGGGERKVRVKDKKKENYPYCAKIGVEGMTCTRCRERVENALNREEGVWAQVDLKEKSAVIRTKRMYSEEELERVIRQAGYRLTSFELTKAGGGQGRCLS